MQSLSESLKELLERESSGGRLSIAITEAAQGFRVCGVPAFDA